MYTFFCVHTCVLHDINKNCAMYTSSRHWQCVCFQKWHLERETTGTAVAAAAAFHARSRPTRCYRHYLSSFSHKRILYYPAGAGRSGSSSITCAASNPDSNKSMPRTSGADCDSRVASITAGCCSFRRTVGIFSPDRSSSVRPSAAEPPAAIAPHLRHYVPQTDSDRGKQRTRLPSQSRVRAARPNSIR